jgi:hypothetical protein
MDAVNIQRYVPSVLWVALLIPSGSLIQFYYLKIEKQLATCNRHRSFDNTQLTQIIYLWNLQSEILIRFKINTALHYRSESFITYDVES